MSNGPDGFGRLNDRTILALEWAVLLLALPPVLLGTPAALLILLFIPVLWTIRRYTAGYFVPATPLNGALALLFFMVLVSVIASLDLALSWPKVAGVLFGIALFFAVVNTARSTARALGLSLLAHLGFGIAVAAIGILTVPLTAKLPLLGPVLRRAPPGIGALSTSLAVHPNEVAGVLLWVAPLALALAVALLREPRAARGLGVSRPLLPLFIALLVVGALWQSGALILTQSRAGWLGLATAVLFMTAVALAGQRRQLIAAFLAFCIGALALWNFAGPLLRRQWVNDLFGLRGESLGISGLTGREEIWRRALYGIADFPLTGMGLGTFRRVMPVLYPVAPTAGGDVGHAHNQFLQATLDLGVPGLIAYLAIWIGCGIMLWQAWSAAESSWSRAVALGLAGCLLAYFVYGLVDAVALGARPGFIFWYLLGLVTAVYLRRRQEQGPPREGSQRFTGDA